MKERPILFSDPMVRAILDGRKTQTRRVVKPQPSEYTPTTVPSSGQRKKHEIPHFDAYCGARKTEKNPRGQGGYWCWWDEYDRQGDDWIKCPYGAPGDRLWVRETHYIKSGVLSWAGVSYTVGPVDQNGHIQYAVHKAGFDRTPPSPWRPSIHMPRWASRITLEVVNVRVERLQSISKQDAIAEGLSRISKDQGQTWKWGICDPDGLPGDDGGGWAWKEWDVNPRLAYKHLWESINGPGSWDKNPWVWVIEFKRAEAGR